MGIIRAAINSVGGALADSYLDAYRPYHMGVRTVVSPGVFADDGTGRNTNTKRANNVISNGSKIQVAAGQLMCVVDGGSVVDYAAEPGYYTVTNSSAPSLFNGEFKKSLSDGWDRIKFGGNQYKEQRVIYINLRTMEGIKFGTRTPVPFFDEKYQIDVAVRAFGTFSIKISEPWKFFNEVIPSECIMEGASLEVDDFLNDTFMSEYLGALGEALSNMSVENIPLSRIPTQTGKLSQYMRDALAPIWKESRGIEIVNVGISSITYDDDTKKLLQERNRAVVYSDPTMREAYVQTAVARGIEAAGSNPNGAANAFMGINMGMGAAGGFMGTASNTNLQQMQMQQQMQQQQMQMQQQQAQYAQQQQAQHPETVQKGWDCSCGHKGNTGKFCAECGAKKPEPKPIPTGGAWTCSCGASNTGKFCAECGQKRPESRKIKCDKCGYEPDMTKPIPKFCPECGDPINEADYI